MSVCVCAGKARKLTSRVMLCLGVVVVGTAVRLHMICVRVCVSVHACVYATHLIIVFIGLALAAIAEGPPTGAAALLG